MRPIRQIALIGAVALAGRKGAPVLDAYFWPFRDSLLTFARDEVAVELAEKTRVLADVRFRGRALAGNTSSAPNDRVQLTLNTSEAKAVLAILDRRADGKPVSDTLWTQLFSTVPYVRLKKREASMQRDFTDADFRAFVVSADLARRRAALHRTLKEWKAADLRATAQRILPYLPASARVRASVYPVIKPRQNSFVFDMATDPAIFLYLDPDQSPSDFRNTVAHESHHIGYANANKEYEERIKGLPEHARKAAEWMGAFGEGLAVLAAAGSPDVHPMADFKPDDRIRWDQDMKFFDQLFAQVNQFFVDAVSGGFSKPEVADHVASTFFGYRGPWYTVGYRMGAVIERRFGRAVLIDCMSDPRTLLSTYNRAAAEQNASGKDKLPLWSAEVLEAVGAATTNPR